MELAKLQRNGHHGGVLHNYGPANLIGTIHIEVSDTLPAKDMDSVRDTVQTKMKELYSDYDFYIQNDIAYNLYK